MALIAGARLGPYEVVHELGRGGMGVVWRARDTRLKRDVALKVLPDDLLGDRDRVSRFQREAEVLATLTHPHIAAIYGLEEAPTEGAGSPQTRALVLELVEGETLADRLARGQLSVDEALVLAGQIAEALEYAHERGVLHRDLKPANIKVTPQEQAKILDFGLARLAEGQSAGSRFQAPRTPGSDSVTVTSPAHLRTPAGGLAPVGVGPRAVPLTESGMLLGTAAYMSPEQARGKEVDKRSDIWAFGCVLYEMLTGRPAFDGESATDVLAAVVTREPDFTQLPAATPHTIRRLLVRCLEKDPKRRLRDIGDARLELDTPAADHRGSRVTLGERLNNKTTALPWLVAGGLAALATLLGVLLFRASGPPTPSRLIQVDARVSRDAALVLDQGPAVAISPDGTVMAFVGRRLGQPQQLFVRRLDQLEATPLAGTDDARIPFFSPDSQWLAFFAAGKLKKVPVVGGAVVVLCDAPNGRGGSWGEDGSIVFTPDNVFGSLLHRVAAVGGTPQTIAPSDTTDASQRWPQILPGGVGVIYTASANISSFSDADVVVQPLPNGARRKLVERAAFSRYLSSGHLVFVRDGRLLAAPFDVGNLQLMGDPVPVAENVAWTVGTGAAHFDVSRTGLAMYVEGGTLATPLQWLSRDGTITPLGVQPADWSNPRISHDGTRVAMDIFDGRQSDIWVLDLGRTALTRLTFGPAEDWLPVWTPDDARIAFRSAGPDYPSRNHWVMSDGSGREELLTSSSGPQGPSSWHPSGRVFAFVESTPTSNVDLVTTAVDTQDGVVKAGPPSSFLKTSARELTPMFSPDGRWIAYVSNESGRDAVYVRPYPGPGGQWLVGPEGTHPMWARGQRELFYLGPDRRLMVAAYSATQSTFSAEPPRVWTQARALVRPRGPFGSDGRAFDVHPDGDRVLGAWAHDGDSGAAQSTVVLAFNFFDELRRLAPAGR